MFDYAELIAFTLVLVSIGAVSMLSGLLRVYRSVTPPMLYIFVGVVAQVILQHTGYSVGDSPGVRNLILLIAELTLSYVLFHDASVVDLHEIEWHIPGRLLTVGMPLTLVLLYFVTAALLPTISFFAKLLIAAALTPTDAGLGAATVTNHHVPSRVRQALNVESGINDGVITPIVLIAIAGMREGEDGGPGLIPKVALIPISISIALTIFIAPAFTWSLDYSKEKHISTNQGREMAMIMFPLVLYTLSLISGANAFITVFLSGGVFGYFSQLHHEDHSLTSLLEHINEFLAGCAWFLSGQLFVSVCYEFGFHWQWAVIAICALVPLRIVPVYLSLLGTDLGIHCRLFLGWFGPRGLASVIFALLADEELHLESRRLAGADAADDRLSDTTGEFLGTILFTVIISVFAHGASAHPLAESYQKLEPHQLKARPSLSAKSFRVRGMQLLHQMPSRSFKFQGGGITTFMQDRLQHTVELAQAGLHSAAGLASGAAHMVTEGACSAGHVAAVVSQQSMEGASHLAHDLAHGSIKAAHGSMKAIASAGNIAGSVAGTVTQGVCTTSHKLAEGMHHVGSGVIGVAGLSRNCSTGATSATSATSLSSQGQGQGQGHMYMYEGDANSLDNLLGGAEEGLYGDTINRGGDRGTGAGIAGSGARAASPTMGMSITDVLLQEGSESLLQASDAQVGYRQPIHGDQPGTHPQRDASGHQLQAASHSDFFVGESARHAEAKD